MGRTLRRRRKKHQNKNAPALNNNPEIITLLQTLKRNNWHNETRLELRDFPLTGRGVCSRTSIAANDVLIKVPIASMITLRTVDTPDFLALLTPRRPLTSHALLALFLCLEKHKNAASPWKFYLDSLPDRNPLPLTSAGLPDDVVARMGRFAARFARTWETALEAINPGAKCAHCNTKSDRIFTDDAFSWSYAVINTRGVYFNPEYVGSGIVDRLTDAPCLALCPFLDMFNHSPEARTSSEIIRQHSGDFYVLRSARKERKHRQIFVSYGAHDNVALFVEYGFFVAGNPFDTWPLHFEALCERVALGDEQRAFIRRKELDRDLFVAASGELSFNLKAVLFVSMCTKKGDFERVHRADYDARLIAHFERTVCGLIDVPPPLATPDVVTHGFCEYLINLPINIVNKLRARALDE